MPAPPLESLPAIVTAVFINFTSSDLSQRFTVSSRIAGNPAMKSNTAPRSHARLPDRSHRPHRIRQLSETLHFLRFSTHRENLQKPVFLLVLCQDFLLPADKSAVMLADSHFPGGTNLLQIPYRPFRCNAFVTCSRGLEVAAIIFTF